MGTRPDPDTNLLTLQIRLIGASPPVWRRVEIAGDVTVEVFGEILQAAMGWRNLHRHEIVRLPAGRRRGGLPPGEQGPADEWAVPLTALLSQPGERVGYRYDLVARWEHEVEVVHVGPRPADHPRATLLDGRGSCPADVEPGTRGSREPAAFHVAGADSAVRRALDLPHGRGDIAVREAELMAWFVDWVGDGVGLTRSGRLMDEAVARILAARSWSGPGHTAAAHRTGTTTEDRAYPVLVLDSRARALGLVENRSGTLLATGRGRELAEDRGRLAVEITEAYPRSVLWGSAPRGWSARG